MRAWPALISGALFGLGLTLSGMLDPAKVLGFLNIIGAWIPDLIFVMGGAVLFGTGWGLSGYYPGPALVSLL